MSSPPRCLINELPDELLSRILVVAAVIPRESCIYLHVGSFLSGVCRRWRRLCFSTPELWDTVSLEAPRPGQYRQRWLDGNLRVLQRASEHVRHLDITDLAAVQPVLEPLMQAAPCALQSLQLHLEWGPHLSGLPQQLALARARYTSLARLELDISDEYAYSFGQAAQQQPGASAAQLKARLLGGIVAGVAGLARTLTELKLRIPPAGLPSLAPLTALRRLRRLDVASCNELTPLLTPAPAQFPCLEEYSMNSLAGIQVAGVYINAASWVAAPAGTLRVQNVDASHLPALLPLLRPPAAAPLVGLHLVDLFVEEDAAASAAALEACAPHWENVHDLDLWMSPELPSVLEPLLRLLPRLDTLRLAHCSLTTLPTGPYLSGLRTLCLPDNDLRDLPPALLQATRVQHLELRGNQGLRPSAAELQLLLQALPELQQLNLRQTGICEDAAAALRATAAERSLTVLQ
ncbi:hypothetical protein COHA_008003 [Chlorella ohadii]|uniref:Uncharacterized protein n=1 Tax=Chlorella ohadii TaxID=2649997 RepID=A0AAD5DKS2_9CHLO|nr:hypothetical protein COHA_008003 [Chlorella ohadii]